MGRRGRERRRRSSQSAPTAPSRVRSGLSKADVGSISSKGELAILLKNDELFSTRRHRDTRPRPLERRDAARSSGGRVLCELGAQRRGPGSRPPLGDRTAAARIPRRQDARRSATDLWWVKVSPGGDLVAVAESDSAGAQHRRLRLEGRQTHAGEWAHRDYGTGVVAAR